MSGQTEKSCVTVPMTMRARALIWLPFAHMAANVCSGALRRGRCQLSLFGQTVKQTLEALTGQMKMSLTDCIVMPNHLHFIVMIEEAAAPGDKRASVIDLVRDLKSLTTRAYIQLVKEGQCPPFDGKIWQRSFYDSIIDNYEQYVNASYYIETNPQNWHADIYHT